MDDEAHDSDERWQAWSAIHRCAVRIVDAAAAEPGKHLVDLGIVLQAMGDGSAADGLQRAAEQVLRVCLLKVGGVDDDAASAEKSPPGDERPNSSRMHLWREWQNPEMLREGWADA